MENNNPFNDLSDDSIRRWLASHYLAIDMGVNVGQIARDKAQGFEMELIRRRDAVDSLFAAQEASSRVRSELGLS